MEFNLIPDKFKIFYFENGKVCLGTVMDFMREENPLFKEWVEWKKTLNVKLKGYLITINPKDTVPLNRFYDRVERAMSKKWIKKSQWCFEWRNGDKGLHSHGLILYDKKRPSEIKREFINTFKSMIGNNMHVNFKPVFTKIEFDRCVDYLKGIKKGNKKNNYDEDKNNREKYNLKDIYNYAARDI